MKTMKRLSLLAALMAVTGIAQAQFSSTVTAVSDYDFRGTSQNALDPTVQVSADYAIGGFAMGVWASQIDFGDDEEYEVDVYAGYTGEISESASWTAGFVYYAYPEGEAIDNSQEVYFGINVGKFSAKQWFSDDYAATDHSGQYTEFNYTQPIGEGGAFVAHAGYSWGSAWKASDIWGDTQGHELWDYSAGFTFSSNNWNVAAKLTGVDAGVERVKDDIGNNEFRLVFSFGTTFPWKD